MEPKQQTLAAFCAATASDAPTPGGGGVAAAVAALAAALSAMVARLTIGKKGYQEQEAAMQLLAEKADALRIQLLDDIQRDGDSFDAFMAALALPKENEAQKAARRDAMQTALKEAARVPLAIAERAAQVMPLAEQAVRDGNRNLVTDGLISAVLARAACVSALYNVKINLASIQDQELTDSLWQQVRSLQQEVTVAEARILALQPDLI